MNTPIRRGSLLLSLLSSGSTLLCCVIPAILVLLGAGSSLAAFVGLFPQVIWLSEHKIWLFGFGALMLPLSYFLSFSGQSSCPTDPQLAQTCKETKRWTQILWWGSALLFGIGFGVSYIVPLLLS